MFAWWSAAQISHCSNPAWLGMGIGFNMFSADMAICQWTGSSMTCVDRTSSDLVAPVADTDAGGTNDVIVLSHSCDSALSVTFQRPTGATNDDVDKPIQSGQQVSCAVRRTPRSGDLTRCAAVSLRA